MLTGKIQKIIKLGVPRCHNHFYNSAHNPDWVHLSYDWLHCPNLLESGFIEVEGVKYPKDIYKRMPYSLCQKYFPNHITLWHRNGDMTEEDFGTQYEMLWLLDSDLFLNESDQAALLGDFEFKQGTEEYYFGLDIAGGAQIAAGGCFTNVSIGRIRNGRREKVAAYAFVGDSVDQIENILSIVHPNYGKFRCIYGLCDYGYNSAIVDMLIKEGVKTEGVLFGARDSNTGKNMKNSMYDSFLFELRSGNFKYPSPDYLRKDKVLKSNYDEWCLLERHRGLGLNDKIDPPPGVRSDGCCADILLNKAFTAYGDVATVKGTKRYVFPELLQGVSTSEGISNGQRRDNIGSSNRESKFPRMP
jgi:hypothetical protein